MKVINYSEGCTPDPESVQEGLRIYRENIIKLVLKEWEKRNIEEKTDGIINTSQKGVTTFMEYILHNTDIFDEAIAEKFDELLKVDMDYFYKEKIYEMTVTFHENLFKDSRADIFPLPEPSYKNRKITRPNKFDDVLSYQLDILGEILEKNGIESYCKIIQGDDLETENIIKIEICEDISEPHFSGSSKKKNRMKINIIGGEFNNRGFALAYNYLKNKYLKMMQNLN